MAGNRVFSLSQGVLSCDRKDYFSGQIFRPKWKSFGPAFDRSIPISVQLQRLQRILFEQICSQRFPMRITPKTGHKTEYLGKKNTAFMVSNIL
jgi:hypothetical protein